MQAPIPTSHHTHTHMLGTHPSSRLIPMFSWSSSGETLICAHSDRLPPRRSSDRGSPAYLSLVLCLFRSYDDVKPCWFTRCGSILPGFTVTGSSPLYKSRTFPFRLQRMRAKGDTFMQPGDYVLHVSTQHHTSMHVQGPHASS